jgi:lysophospholipase L1-like esterase
MSLVTYARTGTVHCINNSDYGIHGGEGTFGLRLSSFASGVQAYRFHRAHTNTSKLGLLTGPARTNLLLHTNDLSNAAWVKTGFASLTAVTVTGNAIEGPTGATTAAHIKSTSPSGVNFCLFQNVAVTAGLSYTFSVYLKAVSRRINDPYFLNDAASEMRIRIYNVADSTLLFNSSPGIVGTSWRRYTVSGIIPGGVTDVRLVIFSQYAATELYADCAQFEQLAHETEWISTTSSTVTIPKTDIYLDEAQIRLGYIKGEIEMSFLGEMNGLAEERYLFDYRAGSALNSNRIRLQKLTDDTVRVEFYDTTPSLVHTIISRTAIDWQYENTFRVSWDSASYAALTINGEQQVSHGDWVPFQYTIGHFPRIGICCERELTTGSHIYGSLSNFVLRTEPSEQLPLKWMVMVCGDSHAKGVGDDFLGGWRSRLKTYLKEQIRFVGERTDGRLTDGLHTAESSRSTATCLASGLNTLNKNKNVNVVVWQSGDNDNPVDDAGVRTFVTALIAAVVQIANHSTQPNVIVLGFPRKDQTTASGQRNKLYNDLLAEQIQGAHSRITFLNTTQQLAFRSMYNADGTHMTKYGHDLVAEKVQEIIKGLPGYSGASELAIIDVLNDT